MPPDTLTRTSIDSATLLLASAHWDGADLIVVELSGESDGSTRSALSSILARAAATGASRVVVDLSALDFMDAGTVRLLGRARTYAVGHGRALALRSPTRTSRRVLELCGAEGLIEGP